MTNGPTEQSWERAKERLAAYTEADEEAKRRAELVYAEVRTLVASGARPSEVAHRLGVGDSWVRWILRTKTAVPSTN